MALGSPRASRAARLAIAVAGLALAFACTSDSFLSPHGGGLPASSTLPTGLTETLVASGLSSPTTLALLPDGRVLVSEQCGTLRVVKNGALLAAPMLALSVDCTGERGLLGVAADPAFATNGLLYAYYTVAQGSVHNRVSRFSVSGDAVVPGSEQVLIELDHLGTSTSHNGGALHFGLDGTLFISVGDNESSASAQSLASLFGKLLRINPDGSIPADNPFFATTTGSDQAIWALGFRNPYTFGIQPGTGRILIDDVGELTTEEINDGLAGSNYGWPTCEGPCLPANPGFRDPIYWYDHSVGCAIAGGDFYNPVSVRFPASYVGKYFFADYCAGTISVLDPATGSASGFASGLVFPVDLRTSPDGGLYYLQRGNSNGDGQLWRIDGTASQAPVVTQQPANLLVSVGQAATFSVSATGTAPLSYQWRRNGAAISGATSTSYTLAATALADSGAVFSCVVTSPFGTATSADAKLSVTTDLPPVAAISSPVAGTLYQGGQTITYAGTGTDPETGALPASAYTWEVVFHHDAHTHPFLAPTSGATGGSFVIPNIGETSANVYYAIRLTVTDPIGLTQTVERDVLPQTSTITLQASPSGAVVTLDGQPASTPTSVLGVVGIQRTLGVVSPQVFGGTTYNFGSWSDGGAATHAISTPAVSTSYTATYAPATSATAPVFVQANAGTGVGVTSQTVALPASTGAGNLVVVGIDFQGTGFGTISDGQGNSFVQVGSQIVTPGGVKTRLYYAPNIRGGAESVTITTPSADPSLQVYVAEYRGADLTAPLDVAAQNTGTSASVTSGAATTTAPNDLLFAFCVSDGNCSAGSGFSTRSTHSGNLVEDRAVSTTGAYAATGSSSSGWAIIMAAFRPQGGGTVAPVASVTVSPATASVVAGQTVQLTATTRDALGNVLSGRAVTWTSGNTTVATVSASGLVTGVTAGGPVTIMATSEGQSGTAAVTVAPKTAVTASVTAANKVYDGTTTATITSCTLSGSPSGVTCSAAAANFSDPNVGTAKTVTATGITLGGTNAALYALTSTTATTTASITAATTTTAPVFVQANAGTGVGVTSQTVALPASTGAGDLIVVGVDFQGTGFGTISDGQGNSFVQVGSQIVTPGGVKTRLYYAPNIRGGAESVTITTPSADPSLQVYVAEYRGADLTAPLDVAAQNTGTSASVTSGAATTTAPNDLLFAFCVSDGNCSAGSGFSTRSTHSGNLVEDRAVSTTGAYAATGSSSSGWAIIMAAFRPQGGGGTTPPPAPVTASVTAANKVYDGTTTATITSCTLSGSPSGVTCSAAAANFSDPNVGTAKTVTATGITLGGANAGLYVLTSTTATTSADITAPPPPAPVASVTVSPGAVSVVVEQTVQLTATTRDSLGNVLTGRTINWGSANTSLATVSSNGLVTAVTAGGPVTITATSEGQTGTAAVTVTPKTPVTASVTAANKVYDGTTTATITSCTLSGSPSGVTCSAAAANFSDPNVGAAKTVTATGITLGGANAALYALTSTTATTTADITAAPPPTSPPAFIQANASTGTGVTSWTVPLASATLPGDLVVVGVDFRGAAFGTISDALGSSFAQVGSQVVTSGGVKTRLYYAKNIAGGTERVTVTMPAADASLQVYVAVYRGANLVSPLDVSAQRTGTGSNATSGNGTTTSANERIVGFCVSDRTCSAGTGFTARNTHSGNLIEDRTALTAGAYAATGRNSGGGWAMIMAAIRP